MSDKVTLDLNVVDERGVGIGSIPTEFTKAQLATIVDWAVQVVRQRREGTDPSGALAELEEALETSGAVPHPTGTMLA